MNELFSFKSAKQTVTLKVKAYSPYIFPMQRYLILLIRDYGDLFMRSKNSWNVGRINVNQRFTIVEVRARARAK